MTAPIAVRDVAAAAGMLLVLSTVVSVVGTVIVPRKSGSRLTRLVASAVNGIFGLIVRPVASYQWRDRSGGMNAWASPSSGNIASIPTVLRSCRSRVARCGCSCPSTEVMPGLTLCSV